MAQVSLNLISLASQVPVYQIPRKFETDYQQRICQSILCTEKKGHRPPEYIGACNPSPGKADAGKLELFKPKLGHVRPCRMPEYLRRCIKTSQISKAGGKQRQNMDSAGGKSCGRTADMNCTSNSSNYLGGLLP